MQARAGRQTETRRVFPQVFPAPFEINLLRGFRRNKVVFSAATAVFVALVIGIVASVWEAARAKNEAVKAKAAEQRATAVLDELRQTAPAFVDQAHALAATERFA